MPAALHRLLFGLLLTVCLGACGTTQDHRIRVYPRDFRALGEDEKAMIRAGRIEQGFSGRMVYMALGTPPAVRRTATPAGEREIWTYAGYFREQDEAGVSFQTTSDLIWGSPFRLRAYDRLRVVFRDNEVIRFTVELRNE